MEKKNSAVINAKQITLSLKRSHTNMKSSVMNADDAVSILLQDGAILGGFIYEHLLMYLISYYDYYDWQYYCC